jgi:hypothetical protein
MKNILYSLYYHVLGSPQFLLGTLVVYLGVKIYLLSILLPQGFRKATIKTSWIFLIGIFIGCMAGDISWIIKLVRYLFLPLLPYSMLVFFVRVAWAFLIVQYQSLALFLESLLKPRYTLSFTKKIIVTCSSSLFLYFMYLAFFENLLTDELSRTIAFESNEAGILPLEVTIMKNNALYVFLFLVAPTLCAIGIQLRKKNIPKILHYQITTLLKYMVAPFLITEFVLATHFYIKTFQVHTHALASISALVITYTLYYCIQRVMGLRFLNVSNHVESTKRLNFADDFKYVLENLSKAVKKEELIHIIQTFFKNAFHIPIQKIIITLNYIETNKEVALAQHEIVIQKLLHDEHIQDSLIKSKIIIADELHFNHFYHPDPMQTTILEFLTTLDADIFLPIYQKQNMVGHIIIKSNARKELYNKTERDEMIVLASYLGTGVKLLQNRNSEILLAQEKELYEEIHTKEQEIKQYKESIRSFLRNTQKEIGIIFYKNRRFTFGNHAAKELIKININMLEGHPITRALHDIVKQVQEYKQPKTTFVKISGEKELILNGIVSLESNGVIITVHYPEISDIVQKQADLLKNPSHWDYSLYLETTKSGHLINQLIPGNGETLLNFKIELLKIALSKKASLLDVPEEDLIPLVELIHHISVREELKIIELTQPTDHTFALQLFGLNPLLDPHQRQTPLLQQLDKVGTLFIKNIHYLEYETQTQLAEFLKTGSFHLLKSDQKIISNVRFICSSQENLSALVAENRFSESLFHELKQTSLSMPSLRTLPENELYDLADGITQQTVSNNELKNLLELTDKEKSGIALSRPLSLQELKERIQHILAHKSKANTIFQETQYAPVYKTSDPDLLHAAKLGKQALKDTKIMTMLWNTFKNQNKIATFLRVNRSSVNRRCKQYNLT